LNGGASCAIVANDPALGIYFEFVPVWLFSSLISTVVMKGYIDEA
jgi:hypothetical protein